MKIEAGDFHRDHGHLKAFVKALDIDGSLLHGDTIRLDLDADRRAFAMRLAAKLDTTNPANTPDAIAQRLLEVLGEVEQRKQDPDDALLELLGRKPSTATQLTKLADGADLFHDSSGECFATFQTSGHVETWMLKQRAFKDWLAGQYHQKYETAPNSQAVADALNVLRAKALFTGPERPVYLRLAELGGAVYLDLTDEQWRAVEITAGSWRIISEPPVRFRRARGMLALPTPVRGGNLKALRKFINIGSDSDWRLLLSWLIAAFRPTGPYPILVLGGEQGSAKTTAIRVLRALVDPNKAALRSVPSKEWDIGIAANNSWFIAYDNLSKIKDWLSDILCRLATGGGFGARELFTDSEETLFDVTRPVALNAIEELALRGDFADRAISITLPNLDERSRRNERSFWKDFEALRPSILGALLDVVAEGLRIEPNVHIERSPRMADFALWASAAATSLGWTQEAFLTAYRENRTSASGSVLDASPLTEPLRRVVEDDVYWQGTATELLSRLNLIGDDEHKKHPHWPKDATRLGGELKRLAPSLRDEGIPVAFGFSGDKRRRLIFLGVPPDGGPGAPTKSDYRPETASVASEPSDSRESPNKSSGFTDATDAEGVATDAVSDAVGVENSASYERSDAADGSDAGFARQSDVEVVREPDRLRELLPSLAAADVLGVDTETLGLDPRSHRIRLIQLASPERVVVVDCFDVDPKLLAPIFESGPTLIGHNLKFDLAMLAAAGLPVPHGERLFDTMLGAMLLGAGTAEGYLNKCGLADVCERYLGERPDKTEQRADWSGELSDEMLAYAAKDAAILLPLASKLRAELKTARLEATALLEVRALPAVVWLEQAGAPFDTDGWRTLSDGAVAEQIQLEEQLTELAGSLDLFGKGTINWSSPAQVKKVFEARGHRVEQTDEATLKQLATNEPLAALLLKYRDASKRASTYGIETLNRVCSSTGRIHPDYMQLGSRAGRMSCQHPNLQQVPRDPRYRACFRAPEGRVLVKADYSQIELRIAAELAPDPRMLSAYQKGEDLHTLTAGAVMGRSNGHVRPEDRQAAKALNFGLLYGMGAPLLRQKALDDYGVVLSAEEAEAFRTKFFDTYRGLKAWHRRHGNGLRDTRTVGGRRRRQVAKFTEQVNTPVQGTGADGLKHALALLWETRERCPDSAPVLVVHDEIVVECPEDRAEQARDWLVDCMTRGMAEYLTKVPVVVEATIERDWSGK